MEAGNRFFDRPVLNSPYEYPARHWELDDDGQPTNRIVDRRRDVSFVTPVPAPKKGKRTQRTLIFDEEARRAATADQQYDLAQTINHVRVAVDRWRALPDSAKWRVTPETARLLRHWRSHEFIGFRPFFCQVEAVETVIWLTEVAPGSGKANRQLLEHLDSANREANPNLARLALKLATGAGKDSPEGQWKEAEIAQSAPSKAPTGGDIRQGFVYERVPHITLKSIASNTEIDVIWERWQETLEPLRIRLNDCLGERWEEWEVPREAGGDWPIDATAAHTEWWEARLARQKEIDASIAARADTEYLYDRPHEDKSRIRVAGPFTVESLAPHRMLAVDENDEFFTSTGIAERRRPDYGEAAHFTDMILENLRTAGVQQARKEDRIVFTALTPWPGYYVCAEGRYAKGGGEDGATRRAGVFVGPEFGTVARSDLVDVAREAADAGFDVLIACAFSYDAHATDFDRLGRIPVLKARMNADLHMAGDLKNTGKGNLFVIFGEPDIDILEEDGADRIRVSTGVDLELTRANTPK